MRNVKKSTILNLTRYFKVPKQYSVIKKPLLSGNITQITNAK